MRTCLLIKLDDAAYSVSGGINNLYGRKGTGGGFGKEKTYFC